MTVYDTALMLGYTEDQLVESATATDDSLSAGGFGVDFHPLSSGSTPVLGIRYIPPIGYYGTDNLEFPRSYNSLRESDWDGLNSSRRFTVDGVPFHMLSKPDRLSSAGALPSRSLLQLPLDSYLYPVPPRGQRFSEISTRTVKELEAELIALGRNSDSLPRNRAKRASLLYQLTVDSSIRKPVVAILEGSLLFIGGDPLLRDTMAAIFEGSDSISFWAGESEGIFIYSSSDLPEELVELAEGIRSDVADDLRMASELIARLEELGNLKQLDAVPVYRSLENDHPFGYRLKYSPRDESKPVLLRRLISRSELEFLAHGGELNGSGDRLELRGIDFSHRLI